MKSLSRFFFTFWAGSVKLIEIYGSLLCNIWKLPNGKMKKKVAKQKTLFTFLRLCSNWKLKSISKESYWWRWRILTTRNCFDVNCNQEFSRFKSHILKWTFFFLCLYLLLLNALHNAREHINWLILAFNQNVLSIIFIEQILTFDWSALFAYNLDQTKLTLEEKKNMYGHEKLEAIKEKILLNGPCSVLLLQTNFCIDAGAHPFVDNLLFNMLHTHTHTCSVHAILHNIYIYFTWDTVWPAVYVHTTSWIVLLIAWRVLFQAFGYWTIECVSLLQNFDQLFDSMLVFFTCIFKWEKSTSKIAPTKFISNKWNEQRKFAVQNGKKLN